MKIYISLLFLSSFFLTCIPGIGHTEIKKATIPNVDISPSIKSVMTRKDSSRQKEGVETNGYILDEGNIIVDDLTEPKCVFYGNYNDGSGDANQYFDIDTIIFECE